MVRRRCAWAAALGLLRCMPFPVGGPLQGSSQDTRHSLAVAKMFGLFFRHVKLYVLLLVLCCLRFTMLSMSVSLKISECHFSVHHSMTLLVGLFARKKKAENSTFGGSTFTAGGRYFACRCAALRLLSFASGLHSTFDCFLQRRTCHVGAVALGNHTALENLTLPPRLCFFLGEREVRNNGTMQGFFC